MRHWVQPREKLQKFLPLFRRRYVLIPVSLVLILALTACGRGAGDHQRPTSSCPGTAGPGCGGAAAIDGG